MDLFHTIQPRMDLLCFSSETKAKKEAIDMRVERERERERERFKLFFLKVYFMGWVWVIPIPNLSDLGWGETQPDFLVL